MMRLNNMLKGALVALFAVSLLSGTASADTVQLDSILEQGMQAGSGGNYGYYIKQAGGPVLQQRNGTQVYDPASALKTLILAYAMRQVAGGADSLSNSVTVYLYPHSRNANGDPANKDLCPDPADEVSANATNLDLQDVLDGMMGVSNNRYTRALELRYGRGNLAAYAASLGMSATSWGQIFGCGWDGGHRNIWNLVDAGRLYEAIVTGAAVPGSAKDDLLAFMLTDIGYSDVVRTEAANLGIAKAALDFADGAEVYHKGGSYDICTGSCESSAVVNRTEAGILALPVQTPNGVVPASYVWGSFIADEQTGCPSSGECPAGTAANSAVRDSLPELFRPAIHAALTTWLSVTALSVRPAVYAGNRLRLSAVLGRRYGSGKLSRQKVSFTIGGRVICGAVTNAVGMATCMVVAPKSRPRSFVARYAGGAGLFRSSGIGRIPPAPKPKK